MRKADSVQNLHQAELKICLTACSSTVNGNTPWSAYLFNDQMLTLVVNSIPIRLLYVAGLAVSSQ